MEKNLNKPPCLFLTGLCVMLLASVTFVLYIDLFTTPLRQLGDTPKGAMFIIGSGKLLTLELSENEKVISFTSSNSSSHEKTVPIDICSIIVVPDADRFNLDIEPSARLKPSATPSPQSSLGLPVLSLQDAENLFSADLPEPMTYLTLKHSDVVRASDGAYYGYSFLFFVSEEWAAIHPEIIGDLGSGFAIAG